MVKKTKIWLAISGVLMIVTGILCLISPRGAVNAIAWLIGIMTLVSGISTMTFTLRTQRYLPNSGTRMLSAILKIMIGCFFLFHNLLLTISLPFVFAVWIIIEGIGMFIQAFDYKKYGYSGWWSVLLLGIAGIILGFVGMFHPAESAVAIAITAGIGAIGIGIGEFVAYSGLRKVEKNFEPIKARIDEVRNALKDGE